MTNPLNPPDSPPKAPVIAEGLTTKIGKYLISLCILIGAVTAAIPEDQIPPELKFWAIVAGALYAVLTGSRGYQAGQALRDAPSPKQFEQVSAAVDPLEVIAAQEAENTEVTEYDDIPDDVGQDPTGR